MTQVSSSKFRDFLSRLVNRDFGKWDSRCCSEKHRLTDWLNQEANRRGLSLEEQIDDPDLDEQQRGFEERIRRFRNGEERPFETFLGRFADKLEGIPAFGGDSLEDKASVLCELQRRVRTLWSIQDRRERHWGIVRILMDLHRAPHREMSKHADAFIPPPPSLLEEALAVLENSDSAKYCGNPQCAEPYFFADRPNQKYCSPECGKHGQREAKRRYWGKSGKARRHQRNRDKRT